MAQRAPRVEPWGWSMGAEGVRVHKLSDMGAALRAECADQKDDKTTPLELMRTLAPRDPFRRDALFKPVRFLDRYREFM